MKRIIHWLRTHWAADQTTEWLICETDGYIRIPGHHCPGCNTLTPR